MSEDELRRRIAAALHDGPVQALSAAEMLLSGALAALEGGDGGRARALLGEARAAVRETTLTLRDEAALLRSADVADGLAAALERCRPTWARRYGFEVALVGDPAPLPAAAAEALFAAAAEAVANAGRHARAQRVAIALRQAGGRAELTVADDGAGIAPGAERSGTGLEAIRARLAALGGTLDVGPDAGGGTIVTARVPLH